MDYKNYDQDKRISRVFSILVPGAGLLYYEKWLAGSIFLIIDSVLCTNILKRYIIFTANNYVQEYLFEGFLFIGILFMINWSISLLLTISHEPEVY